MKTIFKVISTIGDWVDVAVKWLFLSSENPDKASLTVKYALLAIVPMVIKVAAVACGVGIACLSFINQQWLETLIASIVAIVFFGTSLIAAIGTAYGLVRKVGNTITGSNAVFPTEGN